MSQSPAHKRKIKTFEFAVIVALLLVAVGIAFGGQYLAHQKTASLTEGPYVVIQSPKGIVYSDVISKDQVVDVKSDLGENVVKIENSIVWMDHATCDNQICVNTGKVNQVGDMIVCLPNQVIVQVVAHPEDASVMNYVH